MKNKITFKSISRYWDPEHEGLKPFTIRKYEEGDKRFDLLDEFIAGEITELEIEILNAKTDTKFFRDITYVDVFSNEGVIFYMIAWRHEK